MDGETYGVVGMDEGWLDACRLAARLEVRTAFDHVVNVAPSGQALLWIGTSSCPFGPGGLVLDCDELPEGLPDASFVSLALGEDGGLLLSFERTGGTRRRLSLEGPARARSCLLEKSSPLGWRQLEKSAVAARTTLVEKGDAASPFLTRVGSEAIADRASSRLVEGGDRLCKLLAERSLDQRALAQAFSHLVGLGVGLTPSGDDFIVGALAVDRHLNHARDAAGEEATVRILDALAPRTTDVSRLYLSSAARSRFSECVADAARALARPLAGRTCPAELERLLAHGSTSGTDTLAGMACMLEFLAEKRRPSS